MSKKLELMKIWIIIVIILLIVLIVLISGVSQFHQEKINIGGIGYTKNLEDKVTIGYEGDRILEELMEPLEVARLIKSLENFMTIDIQEMLDNDEEITNRFEEYTDNSYLYDNFIISKESIDNLLQELEPYKGENLSVNISNCKFLYNSESNSYEMIFTLDDDEEIVGYLSNKERLLRINF